eukprot:scaffold357595_cov27-Prasinocladus_malaysianus.AAC.1
MTYSYFLIRISSYIYLTGWQQNHLIYCIPASRFGFARPPSSKQTTNWCPWCLAEHQRHQPPTQLLGHSAHPFWSHSTRLILLRDQDLTLQIQAAAEDQNDGVPVIKGQSIITLVSFLGYRVSTHCQEETSVRDDRGNGQVDLPLSE